MSFANPWAWLFLGAIVPLVILYLYRERPRTLTVPSLLFWEHLSLQKQSDSRFKLTKEFLKELLFWLQLALLFLLALTLAQPVFEQSARKLVLIMDVSASMQTQESGGGRMASAKTAALQVIDDMEATDEMMIMAVGRRATLLQDFSRDQRQLREHVKSLKAQDTSTNLAEALAKVPALQDTSGSIEVIVISDRQAQEFIGSSDSVAVSYRFIVVGDTGDNLGLVGMDYHLGPLEAGGGRADVLLKNFFTKPRRAKLRFEQEGATILEQELTLPPGRELSVTLPALSSSSPVQVRLEPADDFAVDNRAVFIPSARKKPALLVITNDAGFANFCRRLEEFQVTVQRPGVSSAHASDFEIHLFHKTAPGQYPAAGVLVFCPPSQSLPVEERTVYDWEPEHPILRDVVLERLSLAGAHVLPPSSWMKVIAETERHPLIMQGDSAGYRRVVLALDPASDLDNPSMLLLVLKALAWVNPAGTAAITHLKTGEAYLWHAPVDSGLATVQTPSGELHQIKFQQRTLEFARTETAGLYTITAHGRQNHFAANLLDAEESDIKPRGSSTSLSQTSSRVKIKASYWRDVLLAFLLLLIVEWVCFFFFPRRNAGKPQPKSFL